MNDKSATIVPPALTPRFQKPEGWRWHVFTTPQGKKLRFGTVAPKEGVPDAVVIVLQGLSEFCEKFYEVAHDMLDRNISVWAMDWQGQGLSDRHLKDRQKRHARDFDEDIADLHYFIREYVKHAAVHPDVGRIPLVMLGHSMGGNIGLRYLEKHPDVFSCAAFSAPMIGIAGLNFAPSWARLPLTALFKEVADQSYVFGGGPWTEKARAHPGKNIFSSDPVRDAVHNAWCLADPRLQVGNVTFGWLHAANISCATLQKPEVMRRIATPVMVALAGQDKLVNNGIARKALSHMPDARIVELRAAKHEILMESDRHRNQFLQEFDNLLRVNNIKHKLQKF